MPYNSYATDIDIVLNGLIQKIDHAMKPPGPQHDRPRFVRGGRRLARFVKRRPNAIDHVWRLGINVATVKTRQGVAALQNQINVPQFLLSAAPLVGRPLVDGARAAVADPDLG